MHVFWLWWILCMYAIFKIQIIMHRMNCFHCCLCCLEIFIMVMNQLISGYSQRTLLWMLKKKIKKIDVLILKYQLGQSVSKLSKRSTYSSHSPLPQQSTAAQCQSTVRKLCCRQETYLFPFCPPACQSPWSCLVWRQRFDRVQAERNRETEGFCTFMC